jgi:hypothetical protein
MKTKVLTFPKTDVFSSVLVKIVFLSSLISSFSLKFSFGFMNELTFASSSNLALSSGKNLILKKRY